MDRSLAKRRVIVGPILTAVSFGGLAVTLPKLGAERLLVPIAVLAVLSSIPVGYLIWTRESRYVAWENRRFAAAGTLGVLVILVIGGVWTLGKSSDLGGVIVCAAGVVISCSLTLSAAYQLHRGAADQPRPD